MDTQVGDEVGPFRITVQWKLEAADEEMAAAQEDIAAMIAEVNSPDAKIPSAIDSILIKRI